MKSKYILLLFLSLNSLLSWCQESSKPGKNSYISLQSGGIIDNYNTTGVRVFMEYQHDIKKNLLYGISFEQSMPLYSSSTDFTNELSSRLSILSLNGYYTLHFWKDKIFWTGGLGVGAVYADWDKGNQLGAAINGSLTLNFKITKNLYLETMPVIFVVPTNRIYFSTMNAESHSNFYAFNVIPLGIKFKL